MQELWTAVDDYVSELYVADEPEIDQADLPEIAVSAPLEGGCRIIVLSEPPPEVTVAGLKEVHAALGRLHRVRRGRR